MIQLTSHEIDDLKYCLRELEGVLTLLDKAGAGIAAIHVNAAIEQLKKNLQAVATGGNDAYGAALFFKNENG
jgi:hypothetical protein